MAALGDSYQTRPAAGCHLSGYQPTPGRQIPAAIECPVIAGRSYQRGRIQHADARNGRQASGGLIHSGPLRELVVQIGDASIQLAPLCEVLLDNARALILHHDPASREVLLHPRPHAFANWRFRIRACAPYRARTKGKDERGVGYVKSNAIAGRCFASWSELEAHLETWTREVADVRVHGTTGEAPIERFARDEAMALRPLAGTPPFISARDLLRRVGADCAIEVDGNAYSVPWRLIGERVRVTVGAGWVRVLHAGREVAVHAELKGRHGRVTNDSHLAGVAGTRGRPVCTPR